MSSGPPARTGAPFRLASTLSCRLTDTRTHGFVFASAWNALSTGMHGAHRGTPGYTGAHRDARGTPGHTGVHRGARRHTKRARTAGSGRATKSAQALGRLPWFAPFLRRSRRLRPRFDMSFSLGLLSRLKHSCTHWPQPPRHNATAATKVTEKRRPAQASSRRARPAVTRSAPGDGHA